MNDAMRDVSRETLDHLEAYAALVRKWNPKINLVSKASLPDLWERHIVDSVQTVRIPNCNGHWVDLGSGGGFPGIVAAILGIGQEAHFTLVESDQRKSAFLRTVIRELKLNAKVETARIEEIASLEADILSARALSDLDQLLGFAERHLKPGGSALFPKGAKWREEVAQAKRNWAFTLTPIPSKTDPEAAILKIEDIERV